MENGIPIFSYYDSKIDTELLDLSDYLKMICKHDDVREQNRKYLKFTQFTNFKNLKEIAYRMFSKNINEP